ncbi:MAG TPA: DUF4214 domain-containing protein, partial [Acidimicrobiales bacterium]
RLYRAYFLRIPDQGGLAFWIGKRRAGTSLTAISNSFAASAEFKNRYGTVSNATFVNLVYENVLGRAGDAGGLTYWNGQLNSKKSTRGQMMIGFSESAEYKGQQASNVTSSVLYSLLLGRAPTTNDSFNTGAQLSLGLSLTGYVDLFLITPEYLTHIS